MKHIIFTLVLLALLLFTGSVQADNEGTIESLTASGGANPGETIVFDIDLLALDRINRSNVFFQVISPSGVVVDTHTFTVPRVFAGDTINYSWSSNNTSYPEMGNYTIRACWSPGNASNCKISLASTTFYSADSLGPLLIIGGVLVMLLIFRVHKLRLIV